MSDMRAIERPSFNDAEQAIADQILAVMKAIQDLGLRANEYELVVAVHGLQAFVIQHMLQRLNPGEFGNWYEASA